MDEQKGAQSSMCITIEKFDILSVKRRLLLMHYESGVGHIGGNLSCLDAMLVAFRDYLEDHDHFVLSKGHAAGALYITLWSMGCLSDHDLSTFHGDGTMLAGHPPARGIAKIEFATGSLGHGVSLAAGLAMASRLQHKDSRVVCLTSDGEWQEGSTWEGLIFAAHHRLSNLTVMVDHNGLQGFGTTTDVASMSPLSSRLRGFDVLTIEIDGHNNLAICEALARPTDRLKVIVLNTIKGHGVSFMENRMEWHYMPLTEDLFKQAIAGLGG
jgi:transketolase